MPTIATIDLNGLIMPDEWIWYDEDSGISLSRVQKLIKAAGEFDELTIFINSYGGVIEEGWAIYDYLLSLNKTITTIGLGSVYSMATILMGAGTTRLLTKHTNWMVHLPSGGGWGGNRLDIQEYLDGLIAEEKRTLEIYVALTGQEESVIAELLADGKDHYFTADEALAYGWTTGIYQTLIEPTAQARSHQPIMAHLSEGRKGLNLPVHKSPKIDMTKVTNRAKAAWDSVMAALNGGPMKMLSAETADGKKLKIETTGDNSSYVVGDAVTYDDGTDVPDGDYTLSDKNVITVEGGTIKAIVEPTEESAPADPAIPPVAAPIASGSDETVTISKAEYDQLTQQVAKIPTIEAKQAASDKLMQRMAAVMGNFESADPVQAKPTETKIERRQPVASANDPLARKREIEEARKEAEKGKK